MCERMRFIANRGLLAPFQRDTMSKEKQSTE